MDKKHSRNLMYENFEDFKFIRCFFQGCTLLIDAIKRGDSFAAQFLLENDCNVNLTSKETADTALHLVCTYSEKSCDNDTFNDMVQVAEALIQKSADPNMQNRRG